MRATLFLLAVLVAFSDAFVTKRAPSFMPSTKQQRGSSTSSLQMTVLTYNGKKKDFPQGTPLSKACAQLGVKVKYSCKKGDCATCQVSLAGRYVKACQGKVPEPPRLKSLQEKGLEIRV